MSCSSHSALTPSVANRICCNIFFFNDEKKGDQLLYLTTESNYLKDQSVTYRVNLSYCYTPLCLLIRKYCFLIYTTTKLFIPDFFSNTSKLNLFLKYLLIQTIKNIKNTLYRSKLSSQCNREVTFYFLPAKCNKSGRALS